jgi:lysozyme family protein
MWNWFLSLFKKKEVEAPKIEHPKDQTFLFGTKEWLHHEYLRGNVLPNWMRETNRAITLIAKNLHRYKQVELKTGVPYWVIACIHYRESSLSFAGCLHNGDPLDKVTVHVPKGRGPFSSWEESAIDALNYEMDLLKKGTWKPDWSIGGALDFMEKYNGLGYRKKGVHSCYLFSCTDIIRPKGRYTYDGFYNPLARTDDYLGVACIMKGLNIK